MNNLNETLQSLNLKTIRSSSVVGGAGSIIKLELETSDFFFIYCTWRLEYNEKVLSTSEGDSTAIIGLMASTISRIEDRKIINIRTTWKKSTRILMI